MRRLFALYAAVTFVPIVALGALVMVLISRQGSSRGLTEATARAEIIARTAIAPALGTAPIGRFLDPTTLATLHASVGAIEGDDASVLRLRLRTLDGHVAFADDGLNEPGVDDEAVEAGRGETVARLTGLNSDDDDADATGPKAAEVYLPLTTAQGRRIAVLEVYIPYAPIAADIAHSQRVVALALGGGLLLLWLCLLAVSASLNRRLRRQVKLNTFLATHDTLTGLPNRKRFAEDVATAAATATDAEPVAVALIDLDRFREINDALGQRNGDRLLVELTARLQAALGEGDTLARVGGDEFGIILARGNAAHETLVRLRRAMGELVELDGLPLAVEASVGYALGPADGTSADVLLLRADLAMVTAKRQHVGLIRYSPDQDSYDSTALTLVAELATAIAEDQLVLHYQPKGDLGAAAVTGFEALVRWQHPKRGLLFPDAFLPLAEQTELIDDLTRWVLRSACRDLASIDPTGRLSVAVNISARSLGVADFADHVLAILRETGTSPSRIIAEITETAVLVDPPAASRTLSQLNDAGMRISIDDFGTGQTSLSYLAALPLSELKIDRAFVWSAAGDPRSAALVRSIVELGHNLGLTVTAEGVETAPMLDYLTGVRCDTVQGYLLAKPVAPERMGDALAQAHEALAANYAMQTARIA